MGSALEWPAVMAASDAGVFMLLPIDEQAVHLAVFDEEGRPSPESIRPHAGAARRRSRR